MAIHVTAVHCWAAAVQRMGQQLDGIWDHFHHRRIRGRRHLVYNDRTPLERWVENGYFGESPKFKNWEEEQQALVDVMKKMSADALAKQLADNPPQPEPKAPESERVGGMYIHPA